MRGAQGIYIYIYVQKNLYVHRLAVTYLAVYYIPISEGTYVYNNVLTGT